MHVSVYTYLFVLNRDDSWSVPVCMCDARNIDSVDLCWVSGKVGDSLQTFHCKGDIDAGDINQLRSFLALF